MESNDDRLECYQYCTPVPANARLPMTKQAKTAAVKAAAAAGPKADSRIRREKAQQWHSGKPILKMCGMKGVGHDLNTPYHGYPFDVAW